MGPPANKAVTPANLGDGEELEATLGEVIGLKSLRWLFVGGKGGVGKTTTACSIAVQMAKTRDSVLILSTDPAHNLSDAFTQKFTNQPTQVEGFDNLYAMEIDATIQEQSGFTLDDGDETGMAKILPELLSAFPGIDEAMSFAELMQSVQTMNYSTIVFDTAPTGHTMRLLSFPDLLEKAFKKLNQLRDKWGNAFSMFNGAAGMDDMGSKFDELRAITATVRETFRDPMKTSFVCVCIPEFLSIFETERLIQELLKSGIDCSNIVVNQVLFPVTEDDANLEGDLKLLEESKKKGDKAVQNVVERLISYKSSVMSRRRMQSKYLAQVKDLYGLDYHVVPVPLLGEEVRGLDHLRKFGFLLLESRDLPIIEEQEA